MNKPLNKLIYSLFNLFILLSLGLMIQACSQEKQNENKEIAQIEVIKSAWEESGEWVQKLSVSPDKIVRNTTWGQDISTISDSLELAETQPEKGKSYTLYFDDSDLNFSDINYISDEHNKLQEINFDIFVDSADDVAPLIDQWKNYLDIKFGPSETKGKQILWLKNKNTRIELENVSTPKDPGIKIAFTSAH